MDETVQALHDDVTSLMFSLNVIQSSLSNPVAQLFPGVMTEAHEALQSLHVSVKACHRIVKKFSQCFPGLPEDSGGGNVIKQQITQFHFNLRSDEIQNLRMQIQTYNSSIQIALHLLTLYISPQK